MAQVRRNKKMATGKLSNFKKETLSFFYTVFTLLFLISIFTHDPDDPSFFNSGLSDSVNNYIGIVGAYISFLFFYLFGKVSFLIPIIFIYIILKNYMSNIIYTTVSKVIRTLLMIILLLSLCGLLSQYDISLRDDINNLSGGIIGLYLSEILMSFFGMTGSILIMSFIFLFTTLETNRVFFWFHVRKRYLEPRGVPLKLVHNCTVFLCSLDDDFALLCTWNSL